MKMSCEEKMQPIEVVRGTTVPLSISLVNGDEHYVLGTGETLKFAVKLDPELPAAEIEKTIDSSAYNAETGTYDFSLAPSDTQGLSSGTHWYDVGLRDGSDFFPVVPKSPFIVIANISSIGGA